MSSALKDFREYLSEKELKEEVTTDAVANSDSPPLFKKTSFAGIDVIEVDNDTYHKCKFGKKPFARWSGIVDDEPLRDYLKTNFNASQKLLIKNAMTGSMTYLKR